MNIGMVKGRSKINVLSLMLVGIVVILWDNTAVANAPDWAMNPPADTNNYYYGVGSSTNKAVASKNALAEIASRWNVTISTDEIYQNELKDGQTRESYVSNIKSQVKNTEFSHYKVIKTETVKHTYWVLVQIDRLKMISELRFKIDQVKKDINRGFDSLKKVSEFERAKYVVDLKPKLGSLRAMSATLRALDSGYDAATDMDDVGRKLASLEEAQSQILVWIKNDTNTKAFASSLATKLTEQKVKIASGPGQGNTTISITSEVEYSQFGIEHWATLAVEIRAKDRAGKILATNLHKVKGVSPNSKKAALGSANKELTKKLEKEGLLKSIGL